ncbi:hypothetical protein D3C84_1060960 [compost metagenome]
MVELWIGFAQAQICYVQFQGITDVLKTIDGHLVDDALPVGQQRTFKFHHMSAVKNLG